jgi:hypothetical protein
MPNSSSTSDFETGGTIPDGRDFSRRLLMFSAPYLVGFFVFLLVGIASGEFFPVRVVAWLQTLNPPSLYLPKFSDHAFAYKLQMVRQKRPEILAVGSSRATQWRSAMFKAPFYNASQTVYTIAHLKRFLEELGPAVPKVLIFPVDYGMFDAAWDGLYRNNLQTDLDPFDPSEVAPIALPLLRALLTEPRSILRFQREGLYHIPAIGLTAALQGYGFRMDGSVQYGDVIAGDYSRRLSYDENLARLREVGLPFQNSPGMAKSKLDEFAAVASMAKSKGVSIIAVAMPYDPRIVAQLNASLEHGIWREYRGQGFKDWMEKQGVLYFDFTDIDSFAGRTDEFLDPMHPSEPAYVRMLLKMVEDERARRLLPVDGQGLRERLAHSSPLEVFKNEF